jgi:hypothetical protein
VLFDETQSGGAQLAFVTETFEDTAVGRFTLLRSMFSRGPLPNQRDRVLVTGHAAT